MAKPGGREIARAGWMVEGTTAGAGTGVAVGIGVAVGAGVGVSEAVGKGAGVAGMVVRVGGTGLTGAGTGEQADMPKTITINEKAIFFM